MRGERECWRDERGDGRSEGSPCRFNQRPPHPPFLPWPPPRLPAPQYQQGEQGQPGSSMLHPPRSPSARRHEERRVRESQEISMMMSGAPGGQGGFYPRAKSMAAQRHAEKRVARSTQRRRCRRRSRSPRRSAWRSRAASQRTASPAPRLPRARRGCSGGRLGASSGR
jgi:hypothetical protein